MSSFHVALQSAREHFGRVALTLNQSGNDTLVGPKNFVNAATSDSAKIAIVLRPMNLLETMGYADRVDI